MWEGGGGSGGYSGGGGGGNHGDDDEDDDDDGDNDNDSYSLTDTIDYSKLFGVTYNHNYEHDYDNTNGMSAVNTKFKMPIDLNNFDPYLAIKNCNLKWKFLRNKKSN